MCGATITQPVWPVQCGASSAASFSGRYGSPPLPKMASMKSRLLTRLAGAKQRISMRFSGSLPVAGQTIGRSSSDTNIRACCCWSAVKGSASTLSGGSSARSSSVAKAFFGTVILSVGTGSPPSTMWKTPCVVRRSLFGLCSTPCTMRYDCKYGEAMLSPRAGSDITRASPGRSRTNARLGSRGTPATQVAAS